VRWDKDIFDGVKEINRGIIFAWRREEVLV
jgi:hypothetical protein